MHNVWLIAQREYVERIRAKSFLIMTILIPLLMGAIVGGTVLMTLHSGSLSRIAVVTADRQFATDLATELSGQSKSQTDSPTNAPPNSPSNSLRKPTITPNIALDIHSPTEPDILATLDAQLKAKDSALDGYLVVTPAASSDARPTFQWQPRSKADVIGRSRVADAVGATLTREGLTRSGMGAQEVNALLEPVHLESAGKKDSSAAAFGSAYGMFFLMYFVILFYGMNVARSIIEEKTSRIFEVLLATIRPEEMLAGKVIGVGAVGLTQVGIWIAVALAAIKFQLIGTGIQIFPSASQTVFFVVFFLLGYLLYSSLAAALGAMTSSEQELQQMNIFLMLPLIACSVVIFPIVTNPDSTLAKAFSFFPFCTPLIMYTRIVVGKPSPFAITLSLVGLVLTIAVVLWLASRIYRVGILMYGKRPNLPEILRWIKYS
ncbi:MAG: ABC transporter permease [Acidobacteriota bacterium]|nr:ABC transporter permease [Acidobacteriota bacterium]